MVTATASMRLWSNFLMTSKSCCKLSPPYTPVMVLQSNPRRKISSVEGIMFSSSAACAASSVRSALKPEGIGVLVDRVGRDMVLRKGQGVLYKRVFGKNFPLVWEGLWTVWLYSSVAPPNWLLYSFSRTVAGVFLQNRFRQLRSDGHNHDAPPHNCCTEIDAASGCTKNTESEKSETNTRSMSRPADNYQITPIVRFCIVTSSLYIDRMVSSRYSNCSIKESIAPFPVLAKPINVVKKYKRWLQRAKIVQGSCSNQDRGNTALEKKISKQTRVHENAHLNHHL